MYLTFILLGLAICAVWLPSIRLGRVGMLAPWVVVFILSTISGVAFGVLSWPAVLAVIAFSTLAWCAQRASSKWTRSLFLGSIIIAALLFSFHVLPGFNNPKLYDEIRLSEGGSAYTKYLNFGKSTAGLFLLVIFAPRIRSWAELNGLVRPTLLVMSVTAVAVIGAAIAIGYVGFDPKIPPLALAWLGTNLLFTCVAEEAFFRGLIQERLARVVAHRQLLRWVPVVIATAFFAIVHIGGGATYVALAALEGLGYSIVYALTRRVESAIFTHFAVNTVHFFLFTYPQFAR